MALVRRPFVNVGGRTLMLALGALSLGPALALAVPDPQDPPFDLSRVLYSGSFSDHGVLQRAPKVSVFGTASVGATVVVVRLTGPGGYSHASARASSGVFFL